MSAERAGRAQRTADLVVRRATADDGEAIGDLWLAGWYATFPFPPGHPDDVGSARPRTGHR